MSACFLRLPHETLEDIILAALSESPLGPPHLLHALLLTCRDLYTTLSSKVHPTFFAHVFVQKFDFLGPHRRLGVREFLPGHLKQELQVQCAAIRCFRKVLAEESYDNPQLLEAFRTAYLMLLADDGKNLAQLIWAELPALVQAFLRKRLFPLKGKNGGWPLENEINSLAVALFWLLTSSSMMNDETSKLRDDLRDLIAPCAFAAMRYPCFDGPEYRNSVSTDTTYHKLLEPDLLYSPTRLKTTEITYFGHQFTFTYPTLATFAILSYFVRVEVNVLGVPPHLPQTRAEANALGIVLGPTKDDVVYFNEKCKTLFVDSSHGDAWDVASKSRRHDPDWYRAVRHLRPSPDLPARQTIHPPGTFSGRWQGSHVAPCVVGYKVLLSNPPSPVGIHQTVATARQPLYVTFREHYCFSPSMNVPWNDDEDFFKNGLLPPGFSLSETEEGISVTDDQHSFQAFYKTYNSEVLAEDAPTNERTRSNAQSSRFHGVTDIIITGQTDHARGQAWGAFQYVGRMRPSDGLVVLVRKPLNFQMAELGRSIFRGYLVSSQNLVGRWRHTANTDWEAIFSLCKDREV